MENKDFKSKLFNRIIKKDNEDYTAFLLAESLFRLKVVEELNCDCYMCSGDKTSLTRGMHKMMNYPFIKERKQLVNYDYRNCGRVKKKPSKKA